jgi:trigger factor
MRFHQRALAAVAILLVATSSVDAFTPHHLMGTQQGPVSFASYGTMHSHLHASTLERLPDSAVKVKIGVPGSATKAAYEKVCNELSKSISVPGFRKGSRIPPAVLEQSMLAKGGKYALRVQAINALLAELIEPALKEEHGLEPIGQPALETSAEEIAVGFTPGQDLELAIKCDVWPEIKWKGATEGGSNKSYMGLKGTYQRKPFDQVKFNKALNDLRERYAMLEAITDANHELQMGDACVVNMEGYMATATGEKGDKLPEAASGDRVEVILGGGRYMTGLVEGLVGAKVGDVRTVTVTFPTVRTCDAKKCGI